MIFKSADILTQKIADDRTARSLCRIDLLELENFLEKLARQQNNPSHSIENDAIQVKEIKQILKQLDVHKASLLIEPPTVNSSTPRGGGFV